MNRTETINKIIQDKGYTSYLEIGIYDGKNFLGVKCDLKEGLDPNLPTSLMGKLNLYAQTSDDFFARQSDKYDLIFIDRDHEAEQVEKDIVNAYKSLHKGGMILLHDCNPPTRESQIVPRIQGEYCG